MAINKKDYENLRNFVDETINSLKNKAQWVESSKIGGSQPVFRETIAQQLRNVNVILSSLSPMIDQAEEIDKRTQNVK